MGPSFLVLGALVSACCALSLCVHVVSHPKACARTQSLPPCEKALCRYSRVTVDERLLGMGLESLRPDTIACFLIACSSPANALTVPFVPHLAASWSSTCRPQSASRSFLKRNSEQAPQIKAARARQAPAASSSASAGHEPERVPSRALPALLQALHVRF